MKVRKGFVSNSSSSSFVVALPKDLEKTPEAVKRFLFGDRKVLAAYGDGVTTEDAAYVDVVTTEDAAKQICNDILAQQPNVDESIVEAMGGWLDGAPDWDDFRIPDSTKPHHKWGHDWDAYNAARAEYVRKVLDEFKAKTVGMDIFVFEYSDNDGNFYSTLEHGDTFEAAEHIRVSNH